jgi:HD-GYP domain-containing protein (c-di-GMP phosphodiesterase class II)
MYEQKMAHGSVRRESTTVLLKMLGERSPDLIERASEVAELAEATAQELGLADTEIARIGLAAKLRDVGKSAIPDMILNKPGPLDDEEWVFMRRHTQIGARIISAAPSLVGAAELVRSHHEWFNGRGYPDFLAGDAIPIGAQIIAVCDAFGAMRSHRAYRSALNEQEALDELTRCAGTQFSPLVVRTFVKLMGQRSRPQEPRRLRALG